MKSPQFIRTIVATLGLATFLPAAPVLLDLVDADATAVLSIKDVPAYRKNWAVSPMAKTWNDPQIVKFLAPMRAQMEIDQWDEKLKQEINLSLDEVLSLAQGDAVIALGSLDFALGDSAPKAEDVPLLIAANVAGKTSELEKLIGELVTKTTTKPDSNYLVETEEFSGVTLRIGKTKKADDNIEQDIVWAIADDILLVSPSKAQVIASIDAIKKGATANPLTKNERYLTLNQRSGSSDFSLWINLQAIYPLGQAAIVKATEGKEPNPFVPNPAGILSALGLDALRELYVSFKLGEEASTTFSALTWSEKRGLLKLLAPQPGLPELPKFISARSPLASGGNFDMNVFWPTLKEIVAEISPAALGFAQGQIMALNQKLKIDIERDVLGGFAPGVYSTYVLPVGSTNDTLPGLDKVEQLVAFNLSNSANFTQAIEALKSLMGENVEQIISKREYLGQTIYTVNNPNAGSGGAKGMSYAITPKALLLGVGSPAVIEGALQGLAGDAPSFFEQSWVKSRLAQIPANADSFQFADGAVILTMLSNMAVDYTKLFASKAAQSDTPSADQPAEDKAFFDLTAKPDFALLAKYWGYTMTYSIEEGSGYYSFGRADHTR